MTDDTSMTATTAIIVLMRDLKAHDPHSPAIGLGVDALDAIRRGAGTKTELDMYRDQAEEYWSIIMDLAGNLGVPYEPHQSFEERLSDAARRAGRELAVKEDG